MYSPLSNPRRTPMTPQGSNSPDNGLRLKTSTLQKGATFHSPSSPSLGFSSFRRSNTSLDDVIDSYRRRAKSTLEYIDKTLSSVDSEVPGPSSPADTCPVPCGILDITLEDMMAKTPIKAQEGRQSLRPPSYREPSDSGVGSSIITKPVEKDATKADPKPAGAITGAACASTSPQAGLSQKGFSRIAEHILRPLLARSSLKAFHLIVEEIPRKVQKKEIVCLRDVEKTLLFSAPANAESASHYFDFCLASVALIHSTVQQLSDRDLTRTNDRPFTNGYFIDLCDQVKHYASRMAKKEPASTSESTDINMSDNFSMWGGIAVNGREAEVIRITPDGKAYSLKDGREIEDYRSERKDGVPAFKRSLSQSLEDEEEIRRSMARRKKNPTPEELAPKVCQHPGCAKEFARPCDLTKHEKTHSRPWKCLDPGCKYSQHGWPTEKEMDRHYNDKHASNPHFFTCKYTPCPYKSKRESNCKQHMEKTHGWKYDRTKHNGKRDSINRPSSSAHPTPIIPSLPTPTSDQAFGGLSPDAFSNPHPFPTANPAALTFVDPTIFPAYPSDLDFGAEFPSSNDLDMDLDLELSPLGDISTPYSEASPNMFSLGADMTPPAADDLYAARMQMPPTPTDLRLKDYQAIHPSLFPIGSSMNTSLQPPIQQQVIQSVAVASSYVSPMIGNQSGSMFFTPPSTNVDEFMDEGFHCPESSVDFLLYDKDAIMNLGNPPPMFPNLPTASVPGFEASSVPSALGQASIVPGDLAQVVQPFTASDFGQGFDATMFDCPELMGNQPDYDMEFGAYP